MNFEIDFPNVFFGHPEGAGAFRLLKESQVRQTPSGAGSGNSALAPHFQT
jgi:hypothetical protein